MGRPIKKKFFANTNVAITGEGVGGEEFSAVAVVTTGTLYSTSTSYTWTASAPQIAGGQAASGTLTIGTDRRVTAFNVSDAGSGYTSTSSVTLTVSPATTGTAATYAISLTTSSLQNGLSFTSYIPTGSSAVTGGDIIKQEASRRYLVQNSQGTGQCKLVASNSPTAGQMFIVATDANGSTYWVTKLTARRARLKQRTMSTAYLIADGATTGWNISTPSGTIVTLANA